MLVIGVAVLALFVSPTWAVDNIAATKHNMIGNLAAAGGAMMPYINDYEEICVYCHTPHQANATIGAPLWNRNTPTGPFTMYASATFDSSSPGSPTSYSLACLSCHDGTIAVDSVINKPGSGLDPTSWYGNTQVAGSMKMNNDECGACHWPGGVLGWVPGFHNGSHTYLTTDLSDDHPISIHYPTASVDPAFHALPAAEGWPGAKLFNGEIHCPTCHNPHSAQYPPFLRMDNSASALCLTCHVK